MKSTTIFSVCLALFGTSMAAPTSPPTKRQNDPSRQQVIDAIEAWRTNVLSVNSFMDFAPNAQPADLPPQALAAKIIAMNESPHFEVLASISGLDKEGRDAIRTIDEKFDKQVIGGLDALSKGAAKPLDEFAKLNSVLCNNILDATEDLILAAAQKFDLLFEGEVDINIPKPDTCP